MTNQPSNTAEVSNTLPTSEVEILFSNLNLPSWVIATAGVEQLNDVMDELRGDADIFAVNGLEVTPTHRLMLGSFDRLAAGALHQTWAPGFRQALRERRSVAGLAVGLGASAIMPSVEGSLPVLADRGLQLGQVQNMVPSVVYAERHDPRTGKLVNFNHYGIANCEVQIAPELLKACAPNGMFEEVCDSLIERGVDGLVIDTFHLVRRSKTAPFTMLDGEAVLEEVRHSGMPIRRIHASAGRVDFGNEIDTCRSINELDALLAGSDELGQTATGDTLALTYDVWRQQQAGLDPEDRMPNLPVTIEVPYKGLLSYLEKSKLSRIDLLENHRNIAYTLRTFFDKLAVVQTQPK